jgi:hypothetical protein
MRFADTGEMFDGLRLASFDEIGNAELAAAADRAAEGGADQDTAEMFGFLLGHNFHLENCRTLLHAETGPQEFNLGLGN